MIPFLDVYIVNAVLVAIANILVVFAIVYFVGTVILLVWPHTLLKVSV